MRCLAAVSNDLEKKLPADRVFKVSVDGVEATLGLLEVNQAQFDPDKKELQDAVLVRVKAFSLNYREKYRVLSVVEQQGEGFRVLGSEFVGVIEQVGSNVKHLEVGDRVIGDGCVDLGVSVPGLSSTRASAEYQVFASHKVTRVHSSMSDDVAAAFSVGAQTAYSMVNRLSLKPDEHVVITSSTSNTSLFALKKMLTKTANVHAITTNPETVKLLAAQGVEQICLIDRSKGFAEQFQAYLQQKQIPYIDHVIDPFMDVYLPKLLPFVRRFGSYISCGVARQSPLANLDSYSSDGLSMAEVFSLILRKSISLIGNNLGESADLNEAIDDYAKGHLKVDIDRVYSQQSEMDSFVSQSFNHSSRFGKVVYRYAD